LNHLAGLGEFDGVPHHLRQNLPQPVGISQESRRPAAATWLVISRPFARARIANCRMASSTHFISLERIEFHVLAKPEEYASAGVRYIWVVDPRRKKAFASDGGLRVVTSAFATTEDPLVELPLADVFLGL
jgi:hypothetical protein